MRKIFRYECRRLLWNKFFIGLAVVLLFYGALVLHAVTILGVAHTAPFSPWSFGDYLCPDDAPAVDRDAVLSDLLYLAQGPAGGRPHGRHADAARAVRLGPVRRGPDGGRAAEPCCAWWRQRCSTAVCFSWYSWGSLLLPALVTLLPALVFALGSGWLLGRIRPWLVYVWMALPFLLAALPLPEALGLWNGSFFTAYPLTLETLDPAFVLPVGAAAVQAVLLAAGPCC